MLAPSPPARSCCCGAWLKGLVLSADGRPCRAAVSISPPSPSLSRLRPGTTSPVKVTEASREAASRATAAIASAAGDLASGLKSRLSGLAARTTDSPSGTGQTLSRLGAVADGVGSALRGLLGSVGSLRGSDAGDTGDAVVYAAAGAAAVAGGVLVARGIGGSSRGVESGGGSGAVGEDGGRPLQPIGIRKDAAGGTAGGEAQRGEVSAGGDHARPLGDLGRIDGWSFRSSIPRDWSRRGRSGVPCLGLCPLRSSREVLVNERKRLSFSPEQS